MRPPLTLIMLVCGLAFAQQPQLSSPGQAYRPGNGVTAPEVVSHTDPEYSEEARIARLTGTFTISFIVGTDGKPRDLTVPAPLGLGLDEKATAAVSSWRFKPGVKDGLPVPVMMSAEMNFRLSVGSGEWSLRRALFAARQDVSRPVLIAAPYPSTSQSVSPNGSATISFHVAPDGVPADLHIEQSSDPAGEREVISIVRGWRFQPGTRNGEPAPVECTMEFVKGKERSSAW